MSMACTFKIHLNDGITYVCQWRVHVNDGIIYVCLWRVHFKYIGIMV